MKKKWIYKGDFKVDESMVLDGKFIKDEIPDIIHGNLSCMYLNLKSLEGSPIIVKGDFNCSHNKLRNLKGCSLVVENSFICSYNKITSLIGSPYIINGNFYCEWNRLINFDGITKKIIKDFDCSQNKISSLKGIPEIEESLKCHNLRLNSLEYFPKKMKGKISSYLVIEEEFINTGSYINNYWEDLLKYCLLKKINLNKVERWPNYMIHKYDILKSIKTLSKFKL